MALVGTAPPMTRITLVLASASPARRALLRAAGVDPLVIVSSVDEDAMVADLAVDDRDSVTIAEMLAAAKANDVLQRARSLGSGPTLVLGCDSVLDFDGQSLGKPRDADDAVQRWRAMRGREGVLVTGHALLDAFGGSTQIATARTVVRFAEPTDAEVEAYVATGEPLAVAGAFTLDGLSAPFIDSIDGDPSNVIGLSLPLLRRLVRSAGHEWTNLWAERA
ncbi:unannotated protein [freshwater metagenome]|uniref:Unannotated protein n=1 Tax=freshwater metagenome TaxID=449393 RepID=A0A6J7K630_9ZZZZ